MLSQEQKDMRDVMPQPGRGGFPGVGLSAGAGKGEQLRHRDAESPSHPRSELSLRAGLRRAAVTAQAKGTSNVMLLIISLYPGGRCSTQSLQLTLINTPSPLLMGSCEWKLTGEQEQSWSVQSFCWWWWRRGLEHCGTGALQPMPTSIGEEGLAVAR